MSKSKDYDEYINKKVIIKHTHKTTYKREGVINKQGIVIRTSSGSVGVLVDGLKNKASSYGIYWFNKSDVKIIEDESEDINMEGFNNVAIVNLLDDYNKKDYAFALYDEENVLLCDMAHYPAMVVVNARGKDNRVLGIVKEIMTVEQYFSADKNRGTKLTAQVIGVVNMDGYTGRILEEKRLKELAEKKAAIEKELKAEVDKINNLELYEKMAKEHPENPRLAELVAELKGLGE